MENQIDIFIFLEKKMQIMSTYCIIYLTKSNEVELCIPLLHFTSHFLSISYKQIKIQLASFSDNKSKKFK